MKKTKAAFTLIELLVVIAIIGLLSTLSILALNTARARARDTKRVADVKQMQTALEMYFNEFGVYPAQASVVAGSPIGTGANVYLKAIPKPPTPFDGTACTNAGHYTYAYTAVTGAGGTYTIAYCLGAKVNDIPANTVLFASPSGIR